jgi:hypothetical protein
MGVSDLRLTTSSSVLFSLPAHAHELAIMANRRNPSTRDFFTALQFIGPRLRQNELEQYLRDTDLEEMSWKVDNDTYEAKPSWCDPFEGLLASESEDDSAVEEEVKESGIIGTRSKVAKNITARKRRRKRFRVEMAEVPSHFPSLPPKHTWLSSPSYPAHSINLQPPLAFLDRKVSSNRLMEASLRGLIRATDAAVLDSQLQRSSSQTTKQRDEVEFGREDAGSSRGALPDRSAAGPHSVNNFSVSSRNANMATPNESSEEGTQMQNRAKKGRTLSLRLRTQSTSQANPPTLSGISPETIEASSPSATFKRPIGMTHRPSVSLLSNPSASILPNSFDSHTRRSTATSGPWSSASGQYPMNWNASVPRVDTMSPLATPLTPGLEFHFPTTPSGAYTPDDLSRDAGRQSDQIGTTAAIGLPTTVNYKRTWYKKSNNNVKSNHATQTIIGHKQIKS